MYNVNGATTIRIMTFSITTLGMVIKIWFIVKTTLSIKVTQKKRHPA